MNLSKVAKELIINLIVILLLIIVVVPIVIGRLLLVQFGGTNILTVENGNGKFKFYRTYSIEVNSSPKGSDLELNRNNVYVRHEEDITFCGVTKYSDFLDDFSDRSINVNPLDLNTVNPIRINDVVYVQDDFRTDLVSHII